MKNFIQDGRVVTVAAPATVTSGAGVKVGALFGVAAYDAASGADVEIAVAGVYELPKEATTDVFAVGDAVEWDEVNGRVAALDAGDRVGVVVKAAGATAAVVRVRLDG